jgi:hypothetical protein
LLAIQVWVTGANVALCQARDGLAKPEVATHKGPKDLRKTVKKPAIRASLTEALLEIGELAGMKVQVDWDAVGATGLTGKEQVYCKASKATPAQLLEIALAQVAKPGKPLGWFHDDGSIYVTTQQRVMARRSITRFVASRYGSADRSRDADDGSRRDAAGQRGRAARGEPGRAARGEPGRAARGEQGRLGAGRIKFDDLPLSGVMEFLREATEVNLVVNWKALADVGITRDTEVSLDVRGVTLGTLLDLVLENVSGNADKYSRAYWIIDKGIVKISTGTALNDETTTEVVDIADMLHVVPDFEGPKMSFESLASNGSGDSHTRSSGGGEGLFPDLDEDDDEDGDGKMTKKELVDAIVRIITESIGEDMWRPVGKGHITVLNDKLVITQTRLGWKLLQKH